MSAFIGLVLILLAGVGCVYFGYTLIRDIKEKRKSKTNESRKK